MSLLWETVEDMNVGFDSEFFNRKLKIGLDYFRRESSNMLMQKSLLSYVGFGFVSQWANVGSMKTNGLEFEISHRNSIGKLRYNIGLNLSQAHSVMVSLADGEAIWEGNDQRLGSLTYTAEEGTTEEGIVEEGTVGAFYGFVTDGIFQNQDEIDNYVGGEDDRIIQRTASPGDFKFLDLNDDGRLTAADDRQVIGNPEPLFTYGLNMGASMYGVDFRMVITGTYGNDLITPIKAYTHSGSSSYNSYAGLIDDAWNGEGTSNTQPRVTNRDANQNFRYSDFYVSDGSYLRIKSLQIGYNLPQAWMSKVKVNNIRVFVNVENLYTFTNYEGLDPDVGPYYGNILMRGVNWGNYPLPRNITAGINVTF